MTILLRCTQPPLRYDREHVYFAFESGRFSYDCISCGAKCCRGFGFQIGGAQEIRRHLKAHPAFGVFLDSDPHSGTMYQVRNCPPGCFFLTDQGLCGVQAAEGYDAKPETCRLFPFNNFRRVGDYLVVAPHAGLCPLGIAPPGAASPASDHDHLFAAMSASGIGATVPAGVALHPDVKRLVGLERRVRSATEACATIEASTVAQLELTTQMFGPFEGDADRPSTGDGVARFHARVSAVLGVAPDSVHSRNEELVRTFLAATPFLRAELVFRLAGSSVDDLPVTLPHIPSLLHALHILVALARQTGMRETTYQTITYIFQEYFSLLCVLAYANCEMVWRPGASIEFPIEGDQETQARYLAIATALLERTPVRTRRPLAELLCAHAPEGPERMIFLKRVARRLAGRIQPSTQVNLATRRRLRARLQRWALATLPPSLLLKAAEQHVLPPPRRGSLT
jgi:Fe-S-cluster containining protein